MRVRADTEKEIASAMKRRANKGERRNELLEEMKDIAPFFPQDNAEIEQDEIERMEYFRLLRRTKLDKI
eukprot:IDg16920t1